MSKFDMTSQVCMSIFDMARHVQIGQAIEMEDENDLPNRIKELRERLGLSMEQLGIRIGVHGPTINKLEKGQTQLTTRWMKRLAPALELTDPLELLRPVTRLRSVPVVGYVQAGDWRDAIVWEVEDIYEVAVPRDGAFDGTQLEAYEVRGPSMDRVYPEGTVVVIAKIIDTQEPLVAGKRYVIQRQRGADVEGTVKTYHVDERGRRWLRPESSHLEFQPISLEDGHGEEDEILALGRVVYSVRRE